MVSDRRIELFQQNRKIGVLHLPCESLAYRLRETVGRINVPLVARHKQRSKEGPTLDVVPMRVADQHMADQRPWSGLHEQLAELAGAGTALDTHQGTLA